MELRPGAFSQVRGDRGKRHSLSRNHGDTAEDLLFSEGWFRLRGRLKIRARGREACRASNALQKRIVDIPFRCHPATILAADRSCRSDHNSLMEWELIDLPFHGEGACCGPSPEPAAAARRDQAVSSVRRLFTGGLTNHSTSPTTDAGTHCIEMVLGAITLSGQEPQSPRVHVGRPTRQARVPQSVKRKVFQSRRHAYLSMLPL